MRISCCECCRIRKGEKKNAAWALILECAVQLFVIRVMARSASLETAGRFAIRQDTSKHNMIASTRRIPISCTTLIIAYTTIKSISTTVYPKTSSPLPCRKISMFYISKSWFICKRNFIAMNRFVGPMSDCSDTYNIRRNWQACVFVSLIPGSPANAVRIAGRSITSKDVCMLAAVAFISTVM